MAMLLKSDFALAQCHIAPHVAAVSLHLHTKLAFLACAPRASFGTAVGTKTVKSQTRKLKP